MNLKFPFALIALLLPFFAFADFGMSDDAELIVNNRVLATVNGHSITVMDVMKKMDVFLAQNYPDHDKSATARYQFYSQNWRHMLKQLIDNELILADAEKVEVKISDAEIRETIHNRFGPNVMLTLDELGISYDEAWKMIYVEMAVQRMTGYRVYSKGIQKIGPGEIKKAYIEHLKNNPPKENWKYQVLSIRAATEKLGSIYAQKAHALLHNEPLPFETLAKQLKEGQESDPEITINVSEEFDLESKDISEAHRSILTHLAPNSYSEPIPQVSRFDKSIVHRIFFLKEHDVIPPPKFNEMVDPLHDQLVQDEISKVFPGYYAKLRKDFNFDESQLDALEGLQPFILR